MGKKNVSQIEQFIDFIREQGVVGLAIGVVIGLAVKDTVDAIVTGFINPLIGIILPNVDRLSEKTAYLFGSVFSWGNILLSLINLLIIAAVVYVVLKVLGLEKLDKKK